MNGRITRRLGGNANMHWLVGESAVLRRYGPWRQLAEVQYELRVLEHVAAGGFQVPAALCAPRKVGGHVWCVFPKVRGVSREPGDAEAAERGRLLAGLHQHLATLDLPQRPRWVRREETLTDRDDGTSFDELIRTRVRPDEVDVLRSYADRARARFAEARAASMPAIVNHGDFTRGNVRYVRGRLSAIIDFDFTHLDHRVADFTWPWGWQLCDDFVEGYEEVSPLEPSERSLMLPCFWASMLDAVRDRLLFSPKRVSFANTIATLERRTEPASP